MKTLQLIILVCILGYLALAASLANAAVVSLTRANEKLVGVSLNTKANYQGVDLPLTGAGIGLKKIGLNHVQVAVNQFFTQYPENFVRTVDGALPSIKNVGVTAMLLTFVRALDVQLIRSQINEFIGANINERERQQYATDLNSIFQAISSEEAIYYGKTITIVCDPDNREIVYSNSSERITRIPVSDVGFITKVMSVWFGKTVNSDAYNLKAWLLERRTVTEAQQ